jgi:hypothetical protein
MVFPRSKANLRQVGNAFSLALILLSLSGVPVNGKGEGHDAMPEFYASSDRHCSVHFSSNNEVFAQRRESLLNLLATLYLRSNKWRSHYMVVDVDLKSFAQFDMIVYADCHDNVVVAKAISEIGSIDPTYKAEIRGNSDFASSIAVLNSIPSPIERFRYFNPHSDPRRCIFLLSANPSGSIASAQRTYTAVTRGWLEYRLPFADVGWTNSKIFILLDRDCDRKQEVYSELAYLLQRNGFSLSDNSRYDPSPDIADYLRIQPSIAH